MDDSDKITALKHIPLFQTLPLPLLERLAGTLEVRPCSSGELIFRQGETHDVLFIVQSGEVGLFTIQQGQEMVVAYLTSGSYLNEQLLDWERPHALTARTTQPARLLILGKHRAQAVLAQEFGPNFTLEKFLTEQAEKLSIEDTLRQAVIFRNLNPEDLAYIAKKMTVRHVPSRETVIRAGDAADCMYFVKSGEVEVFTLVDGKENILAYLKRGDPFGEMALLTSQPRSAYVRTTMDCELLALTKKDFDEIVERNPSVLLELSRVLSHRLKRTVSQPVMKVQHKFMTCLSANRPQQSRLFAWHLAAALPGYGEHKVIFLDINCNITSLLRTLQIPFQLPSAPRLLDGTGELLHDRIGEVTIRNVQGIDILPLTDLAQRAVSLGQKQLVQLISFLKENYDAIFLDLGCWADSRWEWTELVKQSDLTFVCMDQTPEALAAGSKLLTALNEKGVSTAQKVHLVAQRADFENPVSFKEIVETLKKKPTFHIELFQDEEALFQRAGTPLLESTTTFGDDIRRIARWLAGKRVGLALGGGGGRGFAHIGVIKAFRQAGIPIDLVAGTSMGAVVGAQCALGMPVDEMIRLNREEWVHKQPLKDYTIPRTAILSGKKVWRMMQRMFGNLTFEDLKIPFYAVAADLISGEEVDLSEGPLVPALRASISLPGIGIPVMYNEQYLVDGGVINNLPADVLKQHGADLVIAVNVTPQKEDDLFPSTEHDSWFVKLLKKSRTIREFLESPSIFKILLRSLRLSTSSHLKMIVNDLDFYIRPDVRGIGLFAFDKIDEIVRRGEQAASSIAPSIHSALQTQCSVKPQTTQPTTSL